MKKIYLTRPEKQLLRQFKSKKVECPENMTPSDFIYTIIQLLGKDLIDAYIAFDKVKVVKLTDRGRSYMAINPKLRNPLPWDVILKVVAITTLAVSFAALFVGYLRLMNM